MPEAQRVVVKLNELYPYLEADGIEVKALKWNDQWLVYFSKHGHQEVFHLPVDFVDSCVDQGFCHLYREKITDALGRLKEAIQSYKASAAHVIEKLTQLVPELKDPAITIAVSEDDPLWSFFMTIKGASRPVVYKLPMELIERCLEKGECEELRQATLIAFNCLKGE